MGTLMPIIGLNVSLSPTFSMSFVLFAPKLSNNLLSISKITKNLNCYVTFYSIHCVFQDNFTKMAIDIGKEREGLYYLEDNRGIAARTCGFQTKERHLIGREFFFGTVRWVIHLSYLERLFPKLFHIFVSSLRCEQFIYAKNHRVPFTVDYYKSAIPFPCVYSDVWAPFSIYPFCLRTQICRIFY